MFCSAAGATGWAPVVERGNLIQSPSPRPEQPTIKPTSYTTSWDLTLAGGRNSSGSASLPISQRGSGGS
jgi:hypothetical protein